MIEAQARTACASALLALGAAPLAAGDAPDLGALATLCLETVRSGETAPLATLGSPVALREEGGAEYRQVDPGDGLRLYHARLPGLGTGCEATGYYRDAGGRIAMEDAAFAWWDATVPGLGGSDDRARGDMLRETVVCPEAGGPFYAALVRGREGGAAYVALRMGDFFPGPVDC